MDQRILNNHGGYRDLNAYQLAEIIYDGTVAFTGLYLPRGTRTVDQMVQAARSGKQNIAEGSKAAAASKKSELKLVNVARASQEELLLDFEDFLRQRGLQCWDKDHEKALYIRKLASRAGRNYETYRKYVEDKGAENAANVMICLIHQASYLLDRLISQLQKEFLETGGFTEALYRERRRSRDKGN